MLTNICLIIFGLTLNPPILASHHLCSTEGTSKVLMKDNFYKCKCKNWISGPYCRFDTVTNSCIAGFELNSRGQCQKPCQCDNGIADVSDTCWQTPKPTSHNLLVFENSRHQRCRKCDFGYSLSMAKFCVKNNCDICRNG